MQQANMTPNLHNNFENLRMPPEGGATLSVFSRQSLRCSLGAFGCWAWPGKAQDTAATTIPARLCQGCSVSRAASFSLLLTMVVMPEAIPAPQKIFVTQVLTGRHLSQDPNSHKFDEKEPQQTQAS